MRIFRPLAALAALLFLLAAPGLRAQELASFTPGTIVIATKSGTHKFTVELATDEPSREQGLMFRRSLGRDNGMLFLYPTPQPINMWMKNTLIPLDMIFIASDGTVMHMHQRAVPQSLSLISSGGMAKAVLEVNAGTIARLGIRLGDKVMGSGLGH